MPLEGFEASNLLNVRSGAVKWNLFQKEISWFLISNSQLRQYFSDSWMDPPQNDWRRNLEWVEAKKCQIFVWGVLPVITCSPDQRNPLPLLIYTFFFTSLPFLFLPLSRSQLVPERKSKLGAYKGGKKVFRRSLFFGSQKRVMSDLHRWKRRVLTTKYCP